MSENDWPLDDALTSPVHRRNDWPPADWGESLISMPMPDAMRLIDDGAPLFDFEIESLTFDEVKKVATAAYPRRAALIVPQLNRPTCRPNPRVFKPFVSIESTELTVRQLRSLSRCH